MELDNLSLLTYTHSKCIDIHDIYFDRIKKYFPSLLNNFVMCNVPINHTNCIIYDDNEPHSQQMVNVLKQIKTKYVIYSQEDYILYDFVKIDKIKKFLAKMDEDPSIGFIRLIHSGLGNISTKYNDELGYVDKNSDYYYSTQVSIWQKEVLLKMFELSNVNSIFDESQNSFFLNKLPIIGLYDLSNGNQIGNHYNSLTYPYIATAKVKGIWNTSEYLNELNDIFKEYNINI